MAPAMCSPKHSHRANPQCLEPLEGGGHQTIETVRSGVSYKVHAVIFLQSGTCCSPAEARVALLLASGITGPQMPATLGVTAATIKTHLRRCFEKTGTHSQAELSRLFTMFPPAGAP